MRPILLLSLLLLACAGEPKPAAAPTPKAAGTCDDGALIGKASETGRVDCAAGNACMLGPSGPRCVASAEAELPEPCGVVTCGAGCSCASAPNSECLCVKVGAP